VMYFLCRCILHADWFFNLLYLSNTDQPSSVWDRHDTEHGTEEPDNSSRPEVQQPESTLMQQGREVQAVAGTNQNMDRPLSSSIALSGYVSRIFQKCFILKSKLSFYLRKHVQLMYSDKKFVRRTNYLNLRHINLCSIEFSHS